MTTTHDPVVEALRAAPTDQDRLSTRDLQVLADTAREALHALSPDDDELRSAVRALFWEPVEPAVLWVARRLTRWLI